MVTPGYVVGGRYRLLERISTGGMGAVWRARDQVLDRDVAIKQVHPTEPDGAGAAAAAEQRERTLREGRIAARLTHPHAVAMYDVVIDDGDGVRQGRHGDGSPWLVMEHVPSRSLAAVLLADGPLDPRTAARVGAQLADALAAAHAVGIVHRDVKPGNVLIADVPDAAADRLGPVKITDFGISSARGDLTVTVTDLGRITGTPAYVAPEVARGHEATGASDVFSLGATLHTAVEGQPPFGADPSAVALLHRVAAGRVDPPRRSGPLTAVLLGMLDRDPSRRPTMAEVRESLDGVASSGGAGVGGAGVGGAGVGGAGARAGSARRSGAADGRRRSGWVLAAAGVLTALLLGSAVLLTGRDTPTTPVADPAPISATAPAPPAPSTTTVPPPTTTPPPPTSTTTTPPPPTSTTTTPPPSTTPPVAAGARAEQAVRDYFALLPGGTEQAYTRLGPTLASQGFPAYDAFWSGLSGVELRSAVASEDGSTVTTVEAFRRGGTTIVERHRLGMLLRDGELVINTDTLLGPA